MISGLDTASAGAVQATRQDSPAPVDPAAGDLAAGGSFSTAMAQAAATGTQPGPVSGIAASAAGGTPGPGSGNAGGTAQDAGPAASAAGGTNSPAAPDSAAGGADAKPGSRSAAIPVWASAVHSAALAAASARNTPACMAADAGAAGSKSTPTPGSLAAEAAGTGTTASSRTSQPAKSPALAKDAASAPSDPASAQASPAASDTGTTPVPNAGALAQAALAQPASLPVPQMASGATDGAGANLGLRYCGAQSLPATDGARPSAAAAGASQAPAAGATPAGQAPAALGAGISGFASLFGSAKALALPSQAAPGSGADFSGATGTGATSVQPGVQPGAQPGASALSSLAGASQAGLAGAAAERISIQIGAPVGSGAFGQDVAHQLVYLAKTGMQSAELSVQPPNLGPVNVSIQMSGMSASVAITASHEATRAALQEALPQLHALFTQSGLHLSGAQVGDGSQSSGYPDQQQRPAPGGRGLASANTPTVLSVSLTPAGARGASSTSLIDTFA